MILITGATGPLGTNTIKYLIKKGIQPTDIVALVRDEAKATDLKELGVGLKIGDYDNYDALLSAFEGIDKLLLISGNDIFNRGKQHENVINAAKERNVKHLLYTSFDRKNDTETSPIALIAKTHIDTENKLKSSGMAYTIFRNSLYSDFVPFFLGEQIATTGVFFPAGDGKLASVTRENIAEAIAAVLSSDGHESKEYVLSNVESLDFNEVAGYLTDIFKKHIPNVNPTSEVYSKAYKNVGVLDDQIGMGVAFAEAIQQGEFDRISDDLEKLIGRKPTSLKEFLTEVYSN